MAPAETTQVSIAGERTALVFGAHYDVRYGTNDRVIRDARLASRAANGDLLFSVGYPNEIERVRVRPSTIDSIVGSGVDHPSREELEKAAAELDPDAPDTSGKLDGIAAVLDGEEIEPLALDRELADQAETDRLVEEFVSDGDTDPDSVAAKVAAEKRRRRGDHSAERKANVAQRRDGESASAFLERLSGPLRSGGLGAAYTSWVSTDYGQKILDEVAAEDREHRRKAAKSMERAVDQGIADENRRFLADPKAIAEAQAEGETYRKRLEADGTLPTKLTKKGRAKLVEAGADPDAVAAAESAEDVPGVVVAKKSSGRPYSERNQVWRCGTCHRRTRVPVCTGPAGGPAHEPVSAPAGKRRDDR